MRWIETKQNQAGRRGRPCLPTELRQAGKFTQSERCGSVVKSPKLNTTARQRGNEMEWEEALLGSWGGAIPAHPAAYYRRKAARARQVAKETTTRAVKARLLDEAAHCDRLAAAADRLSDEDRDFYRRYVEY